MSSPSSKSPNLNKETKKFIDEVIAQSDTPLYKMTPDSARKFLHKLQEKTHKEIDADVTDTQIFTTEAGNVDIRIVRPKGKTEKLPAVIYVHGGGWVMGDKDVFDMLVRNIAVHSDAAVFFVNYALSPEAQYPVAANQVYGVLNYIFNNPDGFNIDADKIAIAGDSAGANLALSTALKTKKENGPKLQCQILFYPVTDADMKTKSYEKFKDGPWLTQKAMEWFWDAYAPGKETRKSMYVSPLKAELEDLAGLAPTLIITAENDVLRDEGEMMAKKLDEADVKVLNVRVNGTIHDFVMLNGLSETMPAKGAIKLAAKVLKRIFYK